MSINCPFAYHTLNFSISRRTTQSSNEKKKRSCTKRSLQPFPRNPQPGPCRPKRQTLDSSSNKKNLEYTILTISLAPSLPPLAIYPKLIPNCTLPSQPFQYIVRNLLRKSICSQATRPKSAIHITQISRGICSSRQRQWKRK